jgi:hypothetical protein
VAGSAAQATTKQYNLRKWVARSQGAETGSRRRVQILSTKRGMWGTNIKLQKWRACVKMQARQEMKFLTVNISELAPF